VQRQAHARSDFKTGDGTFEKLHTADMVQSLSACQERGKHQRGAVQRCKRVKIVQLEALNKSAVEQRGGGTAGGTAPTDQDVIARALKPHHDFHTALHATWSKPV
jgi:hypothetical protein